MGIFKKLFAGKADAPFRAGDKVRDSWGNILEVIEVDPGANSGVGLIRTRNAAGRESSSALIAHGLTRVDDSMPVQSPSHEIQRVQPDESSANAYLRNDALVIHGICNTQIGGFYCEPYVRLEGSAADADLGREVLRVLAEAKLTPVTPDRKPEAEKIFRAFGVRSWKQLHQGTICCGVRQTLKEISFTPTRNEDKSFFDLPELVVRIPATSAPEEIGKTLRQVFQKCL